MTLKVKVSMRAISKLKCDKRTRKGEAFSMRVEKSKRVLGLDHLLHVHHVEGKIFHPIYQYYVESLSQVRRKLYFNVIQGRPLLHLFHLKFVFLSEAARRLKRII